MWAPATTMMHWSRWVCVEVKVQPLVELGLLTAFNMTWSILCLLEICRKYFFLIEWLFWWRVVMCRYINMDYFFLSTLQHNSPHRVLILPVNGLVILSSDFSCTLLYLRWCFGLSWSCMSFQSFILQRMCFDARHLFPSTLPCMLDKLMERHLNGDGRRLMLWLIAPRKWVRDLGVIH